MMLWKRDMTCSRSQVSRKAPWVEFPPSAPISMFRDEGQVARVPCPSAREHARGVLRTETSIVSQPGDVCYPITQRQRQEARHKSI